MPTKSSGLLDLISIAVCTFAWGTTWYAITLQLGHIDPVVSVVYRFALAAALLFGWCLVRREPLSLSPRQHLASFGVGFFTFALDYPLVYWAEERVASAVVAVVFASMAFVNLFIFRIVFGQRAALVAWGGAFLGVLGIASLSWGEIVDAHMGQHALIGIAFTFAGVIAASLGNVAARHGEQAGAPVAATTAWAMAYGAALLAVFALVTGRRFEAPPSPTYVGALLYLAVLGSVVAFLLYFSLARRRGYATAAYISALAPVLAMIVSAVLEHKTWGLPAFFGVALVLAGQVLLLRVRRAD